MENHWCYLRFVELLYLKMTKKGIFRKNKRHHHLAKINKSIDLREISKHKTVWTRLKTDTEVQRVCSPGKGHSRQPESRAMPFIGLCRGQEGDISSAILGITYSAANNPVGRKKICKDTPKLMILKTLDLPKCLGLNRKGEGPLYKNKPER